MLVLLEHQAKALLAKAGLTIPRGILLGPDDDVGTVRERVGPPPWMVKAQVIGQRRAEWGGVVRADSKKELRLVRAALFGRRDQRFERVLVEEHRPLASEWFCAVALDSGAAALRLIVSVEGGGGIDGALAAGHFASLLFDPAAPPDEARLRVDLGPVDHRLAGVAAQLCRSAVELDCVLIEANPLGIDGRGELVVLDAHLTVDDPAEFRQPWVGAFADEVARLDADVAWRRRWDGDFFVLDEEGDVALINTGAGSGLFLVDELTRRGLRPLDFSDVRMAGIIRQPERMAAVVDRIRSSRSARTVLVNIHAGIGDPLETVHLLRTAAQDLRAAGRTVVVRLAGRNADRAGAMLAADGFTVRASLRQALDEVQAVASAVRA